jgi:rod shape-determining protein MreC
MRTMSVEAEKNRALELDNERLRRLLAIRAVNPALTMIGASVIAAGRSTFSHTVRLDRGQLHGVVRGAPVLSESGLVGRIQRVGFATSEVVLLTDERVSVDVTLARSKARGRLRGGRVGTGFGVRIRGLLRTDDVRPGDLVVTSGLAGVFPRDLVVGRVGRVETSPGAQEPLVEIVPEVDFDRLDDVLIVIGHEGEAEPVFTPLELLPVELERPLLAPSGSTTTATSAQGAAR